MQQDWSDAWLQQAAGWKAVKEGSSLFRNGLVLSAEFDAEGCRGLVSSAKPRRVVVKRLSPTIAETMCSCPENRRSGVMCEHAVAIVMQAREGRGMAPILAPTPSVSTKNKLLKNDQASPSEIRALRVSFSPQWEKEWQRNQLMVKIESAPERLLDDADERLFEWARSNQLCGKNFPWHLPLSGDVLETFLDSIVDHSNVKQSNETIVCSADLSFLKLQISAQENGIMIGGESTDWQMLGSGKSRWLRVGKQLFQVIDSFWRDAIYTIIKEKSAFFTDLQHIGEVSLWQWNQQKQRHTGSNELSCRWVVPVWKSMVEGSWRELRLRIDKSFEIDGQRFSAEWGRKPGVITYQSNVCYFEEDDNEADFRHGLMQYGWKRDDARGIWKMSDEESIIRFLRDGRDYLRGMGDYEEAAPLAEMISRLSVVAPSLQPASQGAGDWRIGFTTDQGKPLDPQKIRALLKSNKRLIQTSDGKSVLLPKDSWEVFERSMADLGWKQSSDGFSAPKSHNIIIQYLREYFDKSLKVNDEKIEDESLLGAVQAELRDYQRQGISWLAARLGQCGFALLADDMGLGKTLQTIALLAKWGSAEHPALVVVPTSLLRNWEQEIARFAPQIQTLVYHGSDRDVLMAKSRPDAIVTSYGVLANDRAVLTSREYSLVVLDEAGAIRNPDTDIARACFRLSASYRLALTGTPLENRLTDLWSIFQFLQPGHLGPREVFRQTYEVGPAAGPVAMQSLKIRVMPFVLRRTKEQVAKDLPEKSEVDSWCDLSPEQTALYQAVRDEGWSKIEQEIAANQSSAQMSILTLLLRLRQICCDAALVVPECESDWSLAQRSPKMERLFDLIDETMASGGKILVFSQFAKQLSLIERECSRRHLVALKLDGATRNRQALVDRFQTDEESRIFLISLKAGGYGLNLTRASTVVHFDPWWNPAAERQASDRAHRIGQRNNVTVHRLLTQGTVEDRVRSLQQQKSMMADELFAESSMANWQQKMPPIDDLKQLLQW
jgi:superfamily II DNA or RNA helicase